MEFPRTCILVSFVACHHIRLLGPVSIGAVPSIASIPHWAKLTVVPEIEVTTPDLRISVAQQPIAGEGQTEEWPLPGGTFIETGSPLCRPRTWSRIMVQVVGAQVDPAWIVAGSILYPSLPPRNIGIPQDSMKLSTRRILLAPAAIEKALSLRIVAPAKVGVPPAQLPNPEELKSVAGAYRPRSTFSLVTSTVSGLAVARRYVAPFN